MSENIIQQVNNSKLNLALKNFGSKTKVYKIEKYIKDKDEFCDSIRDAAHLMEFMSNNWDSLVDGLRFLDEDKNHVFVFYRDNMNPQFYQKEFPVFLKVVGQVYSEFRESSSNEWRIFIVRGNKKWYQFWK